MKVEIEIPDPPDGWVYDGYRKAFRNEYWLDGVEWNLCTTFTDLRYHVAVKAEPLWTPSPELVAVLKPGWIVRDMHNGIVWWHKYKPSKTAYDWISGGSVQEIRLINESMLPPVTIPWDKCCFRIGGDE
jgi:hypothetical protein